MYQHQITRELLEACEIEQQRQDDYNKKRKVTEAIETPSITRRQEFEEAILERIHDGKSLGEIVADNQEAGLEKAWIYRFCQGNAEIQNAE